MTGMSGYPATDSDYPERRIGFYLGDGTAGTRPELVSWSHGWVGVLIGARSKRREGDMAGVESRNFESPDETRTPDKTTVELVNLAGGQIGRDTFHPRRRRRRG